jgi:vacuolar-type H+-ATPase subunit H
MPTLSRFLYRFRIGGVPGAAAGAAIPLDRISALEAELAPVLGQLGAAERRAGEFVRRAEERAAALRDDASSEARRLVASAREHEGEVRTQAMDAELAEARQAIGKLLAASQGEADRIDRAVAARLAEVTEDLVQQVLALGESRR